MPLPSRFFLGIEDASSEHDSLKPCLILPRGRGFFLFCRAAMDFSWICLILPRGDGFERRARLYPYRFSMLGINLRVAFFNFKCWVSGCREGRVARVSTTRGERGETGSLRGGSTTPQHNLMLLSSLCMHVRILLGTCDYFACAAIW